MLIVVTRYSHLVPEVLVMSERPQRLGSIALLVGDDFWSEVDLDINLVNDP